MGYLVYRAQWSCGIPANSAAHMGVFALLKRRATLSVVLMVQGIACPARNFYPRICISSILVPSLSLSKSRTCKYLSLTYAARHDFEIDFKKFYQHVSYWSTKNII